MAIRIRKINGNLIALCAAESETQKDDLYLDDNIHYALSMKFRHDFIEMGFMCRCGGAIRNKRKNDED